MSRAAQKLISASGGKAYEIDQSLMFSRADGSYLIRDDGDITDGNKRTFTFATWFKKVQVGTNDILFNVRNAGGNELFMIYIPGSEQTMWIFQKRASDGNTIWYLEPTQKLRDVGAWYHFVIAVDTTQSTAADRVKLYINGTQVTSFTGSSSYPDQNLDTPCNNDSFDHQIGYNNAAGLDGYMAETYLIDGTAQAASAFGETDAVTGQWIPKKYTGSYGNNGFYLKYASGALGTDSSGQGNNYTANNLANADSMPDTPTNNFPTFNSLDSGSNIAVSQGNLKVTGSGWGDTHVTTKIPHTGKWYWELAATTNGNLYYGLWTTNYTDTDASQDYGTGKQVLGTGGITGGSSGAYFGSAVSNGDIIGMAVDCDNGKIWWAKNGTWGSSGNPATGANQALTFTATDDYKIQVSGASGNVADINFGQNGTFNGTKTAQGNADGNGIGDFYYSPPSGFKALCSKNLPSVTIKKPTDHFDTKLYAGNGATAQEISLDFNPDLVWIKSRTDTEHHSLVDRVRGDVAVNSNQNIAEYAVANFDWNTNNTVDVPAYANDYSMNTSSDNYVMWHWKAGGSGSSNEDGSINTTATSVNTTAGFSISTYTGTGSNATVGHGLGVVPSVIIIKNRSQTDDWAVYSRGDATDYLELNTNSYSPIASTDDNTYWNDTAPTSSVFTIGTAHSVNASSETYVAYCFANVEGFFKSGTYRGNGESENGPYVYTGFSPALVIVKEVSSAGGSWFMWDNKREVGNVKDAVVWADYSNAETSHATYEIDVLSNGFKIRGDNGGTNQNGETMLYLCWAESPFKYATAR